MTDTSIEIDPPDPGARRYRLERPVAGRWVAGVAQALASEWGVPVWLIRLGFVVLTPLGGLGLLFYAIGWLFIPREGDRDPLISGWIAQLRDRQAWLGAGLVAVAAIIVLSSLELVADGLIWAGALLVLGVLLYRGDLGNLESGRSPAPPLAERYAGELEGPLPDADVGALTEGAGDDLVPPPLTQPSRPPRPRSEPSYLGRLTLGAMLVTIGIMAAVDVSDLTHPSSRHYFAAAILVIGIGLLIGTFFGRSRGLIVFGLLLTPIVLVAALADIRFDGEFGDIDVIAASPDDLEASYHLAGGDIYLDLRRLELAGETVTIDADVSAGQIEVLLPTEYLVEIDGEVRLGELDILGRTSGGFGRSRTATRPGTGGTVNLILDAGIGTVAVHDYQDDFLGDYRTFELGPVTRIRPRSIEELEEVYSLSEGTLELDLRNLPPVTVDAPRAVEAVVGRGEIIVLVPPWLTANISARSGTGVLDLFGRQIAGVNLFDELSIEGDGTGLIELLLSVDEGLITVVRP